ncbi:hypothetical protein PVAP13_2KG228100 [Panicum virgatum]|uniref:Sulfotransferase n=1 Tax=Panicum virgatum TaxID=38727 RepID=A0A8T0WKV9_PANVG|nr:hypothetical protein PVAP13_2KG228100 [Panicum virgatum]
MASANAPGVVGPVPFADVWGARAAVPPSNEPDDDDTSGATAAALPSGFRRSLRWYQGAWVARAFVPGLVVIRQGSFAPRRGDVILASPPKCGTTWLKALAFATMARGAYPPAGAGHPLLRLNPHDCVPFMEMLFADGSAGSRKMGALPSPRLMATHMHHAILPASISNNPDCKIVYICRNPKDMLVSLWHFT